VFTTLLHGCHGIPRLALWVIQWHSFLSQALFPALCND
jgi:hypothetical protein